MYWAHDLDVFQLVWIDEVDLEGAELAMTDYGRKPKWSGGCIFFTACSREMFKIWKESMDEHRNVDEVVLYALTYENEELRRRIKKLNITYNFQSLNLWSNYNNADKPIKAVHFHPLKEQVKMGIKKPLDFFKGENKMGIPLISERLINIFDKHGIK
jgi:hypothetical protein